MALSTGVVSLRRERVAQSTKERRLAIRTPMHDLIAFTLQDMARCGAALRKLHANCRSMEEVAQNTVRYLFKNFSDKTGQKQCALVRFFKTHPYDGLDSELQEFSKSLLAGQPMPPSLRCLTLLATAGTQPEWNSRRASRGHQSIPLVSKQMLDSAPMINRLVQQLGVDVETVLGERQDLLLDMAQKTFNVFHVPEALGSPYIPAQREFVAPFGIRSVLGFGGILPSGNLFAVILFTTVPIKRETAEMFKTLALSVRLAILPFEDAVFAHS